MNDNHVTDLLAAYALDCLDPEEKRTVQSHLNRCKLCQAEWQSYQQTTALLAWSSPQVNPPERIKHNIVRAAEKSGNKMSQQTFPGFQQWFYRVAPALCVILLVILIGLGVGTFLIGRQVAQADRQQQALLGQLAYFRQMSNDYHLVHLVTPNMMTGSSGVLVITSDGTSGALIVEGLPALNNNQQYQLWLNNGTIKVSGGVFNVGQDGYNLIEVDHAPQPLYSYTSFGVTVEPYGGSSSPSGKKVLGSSQ